LVILSQLAEDVPVFKTAMDANELGGAKDADGSIPADMGELKSSKDTAEPKLTKDFEELKSKLHAMDLKLREVFSPLVSFYWRQNLKLGLNTTIYHKIIFWKRAIEFLESCLIFERGIVSFYFEERFFLNATRHFLSILLLSVFAGWSYHLKLTDERRMATKEKDKLKHEALSNLFHRIFF